MGSVKRKFKELISVSSGKTATLDHAQRSSILISFYKEELSSGVLNATIPLLIRARMTNFYVSEQFGRYHVLTIVLHPATG